MRARPRVERRHGIKAFAKTGDILLEHDVHKGGNAPSCRIVNTVTMRVGRIPNENTTKRFRIQLFALGIWNLSKCRTTKHSEPLSIWGSECEESEGNPTAGANCTTESAVAEVYTGAHGAYHMDVGTDMVCMLAATQSRMVRHGRSALPSM
jgi:hypothetical protein